MNSNPRFREQLDAYRSESDLAWPEMAELRRSLARDKTVAEELARTQRFDRAVAAGLADVPVPEGLEVRLIAALQSPEAMTEPEEITPAIPSSTRRFWRALISSRPTWFAAGTAAALLLIAAGAGYYWNRSQQLFEQEQIAAALDGLQRAAKSNRTKIGWPSDFVVPQLPVKPVHYVPFKTAEGWTAVAVDCTTPEGAPAKLFIVRSTRAFPFGPSPVTRLAPPGKKVAAWKRGRLLYVLVEEDAKPRAGAAIHYRGAPPA